MSVGRYSDLPTTEIQFLLYIHSETTADIKTYVFMFRKDMHEALSSFEEFKRNMC